MNKYRLKELIFDVCMVGILGGMVNCSVSELSKAKTDHKTPLHTVTLVLFYPLGTYGADKKTPYVWFDLRS